jgi:hypothetical protein
MGKLVSEIISSRLSDISVCTEIKVCQPIIEYEKDTMKQQLSAAEAAFFFETLAI